MSATNHTTNYQYQDFDDHKLEEQKDILGSEVVALRNTVAEQHRSLERINKILKYELMNNEGNFHYILTHFKEQLNEILTLTESHLGGTKL